MYPGPVPACTPRQKQAILARVALFRELGPGALADLGSVARSLTLPSREELFHRGDPGSQVYVVVSGRLKAFTTSDAGDDVVFDILKPGDVLGEVALLSEGPRTATVVTLDPCELLAVDRRDFLDFLRRHPELALQLLRILAARLRHMSELVEDTLFLNLPLRLAKKLASLAQSCGEATPEGVRIDLKLSQEEWGDLVGATRESVNKQMRSWVDEGLISLDRGFVTIHHLEELERLASPGLA